MNEVLERVEQQEAVIDSKAYKSELLTLFITLAYSSDTEELNRKRVDLNKRSVLETVIATLEKNLNLDFTSEFKKENFIAQTYIKIAIELYTLNPEENSQESYINDLVSGFSTLIALEKKLTIEKDNPIFCHYVFAESYMLENLNPEKSLDGIAAHRKLNKIIALDNI